MAQVTLPNAGVVVIGPVSVTQGTSPWIVAATALDIRPLVPSDVVTVQQGTSPWVISATALDIRPLNFATDSVTSRIQDSSGNVLTSTVGSLNVNLTNAVSQGPSGLPGNAWYTRITDGASTVGITAFSLNTNITNASLAITQGTSPWVISGTVAATQSGAWTTGRTWTLASGTDSVAAVQSGTWNINNISGTISLPTGAATSANQTTEITSLQLLDDVPAGMNAAFSKGSPAMGQLDDTSTTVATEDNVAPVRITAQRAFHTNLRNNAGTEIGTTTTPINENIHQWGGTATTLGQKAMTASVPVVIASDQSTISVTAIPSSPTLATYSAATLGLVTAASSTDVFTVTGSATKTVKVRAIRVTATRTSDAKTDIILLKRSTANSGGTSTTATSVPHDSSNAAATATVRAYTANPTTGTLVGNLRTQKQYIPVASSSAVAEVIEWNFGFLYDQPIVLRGTSEVLAVNLNGVTISGPSFNIFVEYTEE